MALYTFEEICSLCRHVNWHQCCNSFCHCGIAVEDEVDMQTGKCRYYKKG